MKFKKKGFSKILKVGALMVLGICFVIGFSGVFSKVLASSGLLSSYLDDKNAEDPNEASMDIDEISVTLKDNEEKEIEFELNNIDDSEITIDISDTSVATPIIEDNKVVVKPLSKGTTIVDFVSTEDEDKVLAQLIITVDESKETKEKNKAKDEMLGQIATKQYNNIY